ncbi:hypothetical protein N7516_011444 [Penicillium verrucosum]|uniref:uncharacterized protein n=1 Tax=Penicillium verrucosum TaxID=60171 RepID=UPI002545B13D|nr:uncharacterized protein N7516_011444 [Penicillium verrucosum]KAJ5920586.1 hypothetical protein N7516_011444 [Penicillium verrucosum]
MDPHGYGRPHSKTDYSWAGSDSQVNHNTFTDTSSIDDNQEAQFEAQFSRDHGIGGWIDPRESQPVIHPNVSSVATSHVDPEHSLPYLSSRSFKHTNEPQKPSSSNLTVGSATNSRQHDTEQIRCNWQGCAHLFATRGALKRHIEFYHIRPASFACPHAECDKIFNRESNLGEHLRGVHHEQNGRGSHQGSNNGWNAYNAQGKGVHSSRPLETPHSLAEWRQQHHGRYPERHTENLGDLDGPIQDKHEGLIKTGGEAIQGRPSSPGLEDHCIQRFHESRLETDNAPSSEKHLGMHLQDKSIGRSMETDFTLLPKKQPLCDRD